MRPKQFDIDVPDIDRDGIAEAQQLVGAGNLTLDGVLADLGTAAQFDIGDAYSSGVGGVQIGIYSAANLSGVTFTVTGVDQDGKVLVEAVTGPNATTVETSGYFSSVTQVAADGAVGSDVEAGTVDEVVTKTIPTDYNSDTGVAIAVTATGTVNYTVQQTFDLLQTSVNAVQSAQWHEIADLATNTSSATGVGTPGATGCRIAINSYSSGAEVQMDISQPGRH